MVVTISVIVAAFIGLLVYCSLALYRYYQYNTFLYRVTQVVPFPIAKAGGHYVDYENYLFELRHYVHYYETQQQRDFSGSRPRAVGTFPQTSPAEVIDQAYIKQLAAQNHVGVSGKEVDGRLAKSVTRTAWAATTRCFSDVLRDYWGWSINDFKRSLGEEILSEKVAAKLDTAGQVKPPWRFPKPAGQRPTSQPWPKHSLR